MVKRLRKHVLALFIMAMSFISIMASLALMMPMAQAAPDEVVIITPHAVTIQKVADADFKAWYKAKTGRDVAIIWDSKDTTTALALIREAGGDPAKVKWDVWWGGGLDAFKIAKGAGLLAPFRLPGDPEWEDINKNVPVSFAGLPLKDITDYTWWGSALSGFGIMYNKKYLTASKLPTPNDWTDLTNPIYKGHIISCPPSKSGSNHMIVEIILQYYGWEKGWALLTKVGANTAEYTEKSAQVPPYIGKGERGIAPVIDFYGYGQAMVNPDVVFLYPPADSAVKSTVINPDSVAILKGKGDANPTAIEFMKFTLGKAGQKMLFNKDILRSPVRPDVYAEAPSGYFNPFVTELKLASYNDTLGTLRWDIINDLFDIMLIAKKDDLVRAWAAYTEAEDYIAKQKKAGIDTLVPPPLSLPESNAKLAEAHKALTSPPITTAEAEAISPTYKDKREEYKAKWLAFATTKYSDAVKLSSDAKVVCAQEVSKIRETYLEKIRSEAIKALEEKVKTLEANTKTLSAQVTALQVVATNNLYYGLGGGVIIGLIIGVLITYAYLRKKPA
mgnify:CR=1 FL=1